MVRLSSTTVRVPYTMFFFESGLWTKRSSRKFLKQCQKRLLRYGQTILLSYFGCFVKVIYFAVFRSVRFHSELRNWLFRRTRNAMKEYFLPRNNGNRSESIPRSFFGSANPTLTTILQYVAADTYYIFNDDVTVFFNFLHALNLSVLSTVFQILSFSVSLLLVFFLPSLCLSVCLCCITCMRRGCSARRMSSCPSDPRLGREW